MILYMWPDLLKLKSTKLKLGFTQSMDLSLSIQPEVMDASYGDLSLPRGKRKAEMISPADSVDSEKEERDSESDDQVWGFDSFDGSDYESPEEPPADKEEFEFRRYARHYHESQVCCLLL